MLLFLTGCGSEKLIATKSFLKEDIGFNAVETVEMSVEDQEVKETTVILEFDDVKMSEDFVTFFKDDLKDNVEYKREEKKVTLKMTPEVFKKFEGINEGGVTKEDFKEALVNKGFELK